MGEALSVVYPCRHGQVNEELRYSLRSLQANLEHGHVFFYGAPPAWVNGIVRPHQQGVNPRTNTTTSMRMACTDHAVTDPFIFMNDDYFIMKEIPEVPKLNRGHVHDVIKSLAPSKKEYAQGMVTTKALLVDQGYDEANILSYELHMPMIIHKTTMLHCLDLYDKSRYPNLHKRTLYGNIVDYGGETVQDNKLVTKTAKWDTDCTFISTSDTSFREHAVGAWIREFFPEKSWYER